MVLAVLLLPFAAWASTYFYVNSSAGQDEIRETLQASLPQGAVTFERVQWGPAPNQVTAFGAEIKTRLGATALTARQLTMEVSSGMVFGDGGKVERFIADDFDLHLAWDRDGRFNLEGAFSKAPLPKQPPPDQPRPPPDPDKPGVALEIIELRRGNLTLSWPDWSLRFEGLEGGGVVRASNAEGLFIDSTLASRGGAAVLVGAGDQARRVPFDEVVVRNFEWRGQGFKGRLEMRDAQGTEVVLDGEMGFAEDAPPTQRWSGNVILGPRQAAVVAPDLIPKGIRVRGLDFQGEGESATVKAETVGTPLVPGLLPEGARARGLDVKLERGAVKGKAKQLVVPRLESGPAVVVGLDAPLEASYVPGMVPSGSLQLAGAKVASLSDGTGTKAEGVELAKLDARLSTAVTAEIAGVSVAKLTIPQGVVGKANADLKLDVGLFGGSVLGAVETEEGRVRVKGKVDISVTERRAEYDLTLKLEALRGAMLRSLGARLPDHARAELRAPVKGSARVTGKLGPASKGDKRGLSATVVVRQAQLEGGGKVSWTAPAEAGGEGAWTVVPAPEEPGEPEPPKRGQ